MVTEEEEEAVCETSEGGSGVPSMWKPSLEGEGSVMPRVVVVVEGQMVVTATMYVPVSRPWSSHTQKGGDKMVAC